MKSKFQKMLVLGAAVLTVLASAISSSACAGWLYQPREPKCLKK